MLWLIKLWSLDVMVSLSQSEYSVMEGESIVEVCVSLSGDIERTVMVNLTSSPLTANDTTGMRYCSELICLGLDRPLFNRLRST